jgi:hypothetical protein
MQAGVMVVLWLVIWEILVPSLCVCLCYWLFRHYFPQHCEADVGLVPDILTVHNDLPSLIQCYTLFPVAVASLKNLKVTIQSCWQCLNYGSSVSKGAGASRKFSLPVSGIVKDFSFLFCTCWEEDRDRRFCDNKVVLSTCVLNKKEVTGGTGMYM